MRGDEDAVVLALGELGVGGDADRAGRSGLGAQREQPQPKRRERQGRDPLREARERFNLSENSVTYRREWLALWEVDPDALVYYVPDAAVRTVGKAQAWWGNVIGLDLGWKDHDAIGIVGVEALRQWSHLRHMETKGQQTNHELFRRITVLAEKFPGPNGGEGRANETGKAGGRSTAGRPSPGHRPGGERLQVAGHVRWRRLQAHGQSERPRRVPRGHQRPRHRGRRIQRRTSKAIVFTG